jgi:hypothetical protein
MLVVVWLIGSAVVTTTGAAGQSLGSTFAAASIAAQQRTVNPDAKTMADFVERAQKYAALHRKIDVALEKLSDNATPQQIDQHQRAFGQAIARERAGAQQGELFTPDIQVVIRGLMARLFATVDSKRELRKSLMDENPGVGQVKLAVNGRYPDTVPMSTMPPDVLRNLPELPKEVEYRFVGDNLILLDPDAHIVVDYVPRVLPK